MNNYKFIILILSILGAGFILQTKPAQAFTFTSASSTYEVKPEIVNSWKGAYKLPKYNILQDRPEPNRALGLYLGQNLPDDTAEYEVYNFKPDKIYGYLKFLAGKIDQPKTEPELEIKNNQAVKFLPPKAGIKLNLHDSAFLSLKALQKNLPSAELAVETDLPITPLASTNTLGINELVGHGESNFKGSPKNRIHNIKVGVNKMTGVIIQPGDEFSFNKYLGPVEEGYGFLPELVIKKDGTVPELGGGLCQVSSTTFRAAMNAGFPITQRKNHSYAVQYYAPQGSDATIYPGIIDLKFKNDTLANVLVWPYIKDAYTLVFEFWGTKDSRKVTLEKPYSYDRKPDGSMKATWTRIVENNGQISTSTFKSVYLPPALFHKEEKFPTPPPVSGVQMPGAN